jgi:hypothetical protein
VVIKAADGHISVHLRQLTQNFLLIRSSPFNSTASGIGQISLHLAQPIHLAALNIMSGYMLLVSGLWHQGHFNGQPFKNTVVLIPIPSLSENL